jgi:hypothetical protein
VALELDEICFEEAHAIERRRKVRMAEIATNEGSIKTDDSPFSKENLAKAETIRFEVGRDMTFKTLDQAHDAKSAVCSISVGHQVVRDAGVIWITI